MGKQMLYLMMGAPGSGKTSFVIKHLDSHSIWVSRDDIRFSMVKEDEEYFSKEKEVFREFVRQINNALENGYNVYADATHLTKASRNKLIRNIDCKSIIINIICLNTPLNCCYINNEKRAGTRSFVPREQISNMYKSIEMPKLEEGFNTIFIVEKSGIYSLRKDDEVK